MFTFWDSWAERRAWAVDSRSSSSSRARSRAIIYRLPENRVTTIGRSTRNSIVVVNPDVSRFHCELSYVNGRWELHDLNSKKGTIVNGEGLDGSRAPDPRSTSSA